MTEKPIRPRDQASWDQRYVDDMLPWDTGVPDPHLLRVIKDHEVKPGKAIEIGCGTGTNSIWLAEQGFQVTGLDISPTAIGRAKEKGAAAKVKCDFLVADFLADKVEGAPFRLAYDRGCLHSFDDDEDRTNFAARLAGLLGPDAIWLSLIGSTDGPPRDSGPPRRSAAQITCALEPHFEILELSSTVFSQGRHNEAKAWLMVAKKRTIYPE